MKRHHLALIVLAGIALAGCQNPPVVGRYKTFRYVDSTRPNEPTGGAAAPGSPDAEAGNAGDLVEATVFTVGVPKTSSTPTRLIDALDAEGQAAYIDAMSAEGLAPEKIAALLVAPLPGGQAPKADRTKITRRVIFAVTKAWSERTADPADRIDRYEHRLDLTNDAKASFLSWNQFETKHETIDLGKLTRSTELTSNIKLSPTFGGSLIGGGEAGLTSVNKRGEELALSQRILDVTGVLSSTQARLIQQGGMGINLEGNVAAEITIQLERDPAVYALFTPGSLRENGGPTPPSKLTYSFMETRLPVSSGGPILAEYTGLYHYRDVNLTMPAYGSRTVEEADDHVRLIYGTTNTVQSLEGSAATKVELLSEKEWDDLAAIYVLEAPDRTKRRINIEHQKQGKVELRFGSYAEAAAFRGWMGDTVRAIARENEERQRDGREPLPPYIEIGPERHRLGLSINLETDFEPDQLGIVNSNH